MLPMHPDMNGKVHSSRDSSPVSFYTKNLIKVTREGPINIFRNTTLAPEDSPYVENIHIRPYELDICWARILQKFYNTPVKITVFFDHKKVAHTKPTFADCIMRAQEKTDVKGWLVLRQTESSVDIKDSCNVRGMFRMRNRDIAFILEKESLAYIVNTNFIVRIKVWGTPKHVLNITLDQPTYVDICENWIESVWSNIQKKMCLASEETDQDPFAEMEESAQEERDISMDKDVLGLPII